MPTVKYCCVGDLGGTNARYWLIRTSDAASGHYEVNFVKKYRSTAYPALLPSVEEFLRDAGASKGSSKFPSVLCMCIAGPVENQVADITNLKWIVKGSELQKDLGIEKVHLINDFEGIGYGLLGLKSGDFVKLNDAPVRPGAPIAVLGAGTGLGEAFLTHSGKEYKVWPAEGGHCSYPALSTQDMHMVEYIKRTVGCSRVSVERIASGSGMPSIYNFLNSIRPNEASPAAVARVLTAESPAAVINQQAQDESDPLSVECMKIFINALAAEAGDLALKTLPFGGLYLAGGMASKILWALEKDDAFLKGIQNKGRLQTLLKTVPVFVVIIDEVGLVGSAVLALRLLADLQASRRAKL